MRESPFFIVGEARSGTTLLRLILDHHPDLAIPWESHFLPFLYPRHHQFGSLESAGNREKVIREAARLLAIGYGRDKWAPGLEENAAGLAEQAEPTFGGVMDVIFRHAVKDRNPKRWGDKTPRYVLHLPMLLEIFPQAQFIHLVRDGRDVASSLLPLYFGANTPLSAARGWKQCVEAGEAFVARHPDQAITVRYEDLVSSPEEETQRICQFLRVPYHPDILNYNLRSSPTVHLPPKATDTHLLLKEKPTAARVGSYKSRLTERQCRLFEAEAGTTLKSMGYSIQEIPAPPTLFARGADLLINKAIALRRAPKAMYVRVFLVGLSTKFLAFSRRSDRSQPPSA